MCGRGPAARGGCVFTRSSVSACSGFPGGSGRREPACNAGDPGLIPASGRSPGLDSWVGNVPWRRKRQPAPVFLPRKLHGERIPAGYSPWGCKDLAMTEHTHAHHVQVQRTAPSLCVFHALPPLLWLFTLPRMTWSHQQESRSSLSWKPLLKAKMGLSP